MASRRLSGRRIPVLRGRLRLWLSCALLVLPAAGAEAGFSSFLPLNWGGSLTYGYNYVAASTASERMQLLGTVNASGYVWQPWFATTSATLSVGLTNTETTTTSNNANSTTGTFTFSVFPRSRFPFSLNYTRTDSRTASFSDLTQLTGGTYFQISRLSLRQVYRARGGSLSNLWYYRSDFSGSITSSLTQTFGGTYQVNSAPNSLSLSANYTSSESSANQAKPSATVLALNHTYTPSPDTGVTNLLTFLTTDSGDGSSESDVAQGSSSFHWRPEHRALNVSGGVRAAKTESRTGSGGSTERRSLDTNLGLNYRITRRTYVVAGVTVGTADSDDTQVLTSSQTLGLSYSSFRYPLGGGIDWMWQATGSTGNTLSRTDTLGETSSDSIRTVGGGLMHNFNGQWALGRSSSLSMGFSQGLSSNKTSTAEELSNTFNNSFSLSSNYRGRRGSTYGSFQMSDSRTKGSLDSLFQRAGVNVSQDLSINRLSGLTGNLSFDVNRQEYRVEGGPEETGYRRYGTLSLFYRHERPFGVYNLRFHSRFNASKEIGDDIPSQRLDWDNRFQYSLGLLSMSASFRLTQNADGVPVKSLNFQATRSF